MVSIVAGPPGWPSRRNLIYMHLHTYVTELALAADPPFPSSGTSRERLVNKPVSVPEQFDVVVVGAGFSGLYMLYRLRQLGLSVKVLESAGDVGGTWYWNRYPGARCDIPTTDYTYSFDPELEKEWTWSEKYATQPEILDYLRFVADRYGLRPDIEFSTSVTSARWDEPETAVDDHDRRRPGDPVPVLHHGHRLPLDAQVTRHRRRRPFRRRGLLHQPLAARGRRLHGPAGRGHRHRLVGHPVHPAHRPRRPASSRSSSAPPNFSIPAHNGPAPADRLKQLDEDRDGYRHAARWSRGGIPVEPTDILGVTASEAVRRERFEAAWEQGELFGILDVFADQGVNPASNDIVAEMIREKIRSIVNDPETAEALCPKDHYFGTKRPCLDTGYFETYNLPHVRLVDLRKQPIASITEDGIETADESFGFDAIVYATGFDAMTGALVAVGHHRPGRRVPQGEVGGRAVHVPGAHDRRVPELLHAHRARQPFGAVEHGRIDRAARRLGGRLPRGHARRRLRDDRADHAGRSRLEPARPGLRRHHPASHRQLLVHGRQRPRQAARVPALHRRGGRATGRRATRWPRRATSDSG